MKNHYFQNLLKNAMGFVGCNYKKFGTNLGGMAFFFFGFTHQPIIEILSSFVLNTLLPAGRPNFEKRQPQQNENFFLRLAGNVDGMISCRIKNH